MLWIIYVLEKKWQKHFNKCEFVLFFLFSCKRNFSDYVGYHFFHWLISRSGDWYVKMNENLQDNLRSIENGVAVIDDILTQSVEDFYENQENVRLDENRNRQPNRALQQRDLNNNIDHINIINQVININMHNNHQQRVADHEVPHGGGISRSELSRKKILHCTTDDRLQVKVVECGALSDLNLKFCSIFFDVSQH